MLGNNTDIPGNNTNKLAVQATPARVVSSTSGSAAFKMQQTRTDNICVHLEGEPVYGKETLDDPPHTKYAYPNMRGDNSDNYLPAWEMFEKQRKRASEATRRLVDYRDRIKALVEASIKIGAKQPRAVPAKVESREEVEEQVVRFQRCRERMKAIDNEITISQKRASILESELASMLPFWDVFCRVDERYAVKVQGQDVVICPWDKVDERLEREQMESNH